MMNPRTPLQPPKLVSNFQTFVLERKYYPVSVWIFTIAEPTWSWESDALGQPKDSWCVSYQQDIELQSKTGHRRPL